MYTPESLPDPRRSLGSAIQGEVTEPVSERGEDHRRGPASLRTSPLSSQGPVVVRPQALASLVSVQPAGYDASSRLLPPRRIQEDDVVITDASPHRPYPHADIEFDTESMDISDGGEPDEGSLIDRINAGDRGAFGEFYERYVGRVYGYAMSRLPDAQTAEDITIQTFLHALEAAVGGRLAYTGAPPEAYLVHIARNLIINFFRQRDGRPVDSLDAGLGFDIGGDEDVLSDLVQSDDLRRALESLDGDAQALIHLKYVDGFSNAEIAKILRRTEGGVKSLQHRALSKLRTQLEPPEDLLERADRETNEVVSLIRESGLGIRAHPNLRPAVFQLPGDQRELLLLLLRGRAVTEVGGLQPAVVRNRAQRVRQNLGEYLRYLDQASAMPVAGPEELASYDQWTVESTQHITRLFVDLGSRHQEQVYAAIYGAGGRYVGVLNQIVFKGVDRDMALTAFQEQMGTSMVLETLRRSLRTLVRRAYEKLGEAGLLGDYFIPPFEGEQGT